ncbi:MAG: hypothetical protein ACKOC1_03500 [Hyphomicrobiales bacterium]
MNRRTLDQQPPQAGMAIQHAVVIAILALAICGAIIPMVPVASHYLASQSADTPVN